MSVVFCYFYHMIYNVIGLMSGSSLDGLDIAYVQLEEVRGVWDFKLISASCLPYDREWHTTLSKASGYNVPDFLRLHTRYGRFLGDRVNEFIRENGLDHKVHFIASHGHTVFHDPKNRTTFQIGDGAAIAAVTRLPVINDLRAVDVAMGGQGAPIVPVGDKLLFKDFDYLLNLGGIANLTVKREDTLMAFDVCPANLVLNTLAKREGKEMDRDGQMAQAGGLIGDMLEELDEDAYYKLAAPKSLSNEAARDMAFPAMLRSEHNTSDLLHTYSVHIATQVKRSIERHGGVAQVGKLLVTGGGAFNTFLINAIAKAVDGLAVVTVPDPEVVKYKEAIVMALIGTLRWREEANVLSSVTGATADSINGCIWLVN